MVGSTLACLLATHCDTFRITVIEPDSPEAPAQDGEWSLRVSAISRASQRVLQNAGAWPAIAATRVSPYTRMQVWEGNDPDSGLVFDAEQVAEPELGYIVENRLIQSALLQRLALCSNAKVICAKVIGVDAGADEVTVSLQGQGTIAGDLLVGADGANSACRRFMGLEMRGWAYRQRAVVSTIRTQRPHCGTAFQRFLPEGPIAFLPLRDGCCSIVWSTTEEAAQALVQLSDEAFAEAVTRASDGVLGQVTSVHGRGAFPLRAQYARRYTLARFALVGDAAHTVHPLAGQGVNLGLLDAAALGETLVQAHSGGRDVGDLPVLRKYERWRKGENLVMMAAVDGIGRLFGMQAAPLPALRKIGMGMVSRASPAAEFFIRRAMGLAGDLPRWAAANW